jgi:hypothetical protein
MKRNRTKPTQPKIHDAAYKKLFSNRTIFQQLIETFITETWVKELDFSTCEIRLLEQELLNLYEQQADKQAVSLFLNWFRQLALYSKVSPEDYEKLDYVYRTKEEVRTMLVATLHEERQKIYQQGQADGEAVGVAKGQRQTLLQLLYHRFHLSETEQAQITEQLAKVTEVEFLTALINHGLQAASFEEFKTQMRKYLPTDSSA